MTVHDSFVGYSFPGVLIPFRLNNGAYNVSIISFAYFTWTQGFLRQKFLNLMQVIDALAF